MKVSRCLTKIHPNSLGCNGPSLCAFVGPRSRQLRCRLGYHGCHVRRHGPHVLWNLQLCLLVELHLSSRRRLSCGSGLRAKLLHHASLLHHLPTCVVRSGVVLLKPGINGELFRLRLLEYRSDVSLSPPFLDILPLYQYLRRIQPSSSFPESSCCPKDQQSFHH